MTHIVYILTMPNVGSWNGTFTGAGKLYCLVKSYKNDSDIPAKVLSMKSGYFYDFGDGWGASVKAKKIAVSEKLKYKKESRGFMSYDWMVKEIEEFGRIKSLTERQQERRLKEAPCDNSK